MPKMLDTLYNFFSRIPKTFDTPAVDPLGLTYQSLNKGQQKEILTNNLSKQTKEKFEDNLTSFLTVLIPKNHTANLEGGHFFKSLKKNQKKNIKRHLQTINQQTNTTTQQSKNSPLPQQTNTTTQQSKNSPLPRRGPRP